MTQNSPKPFVNLHTHTFYSILGALPSPKALLAHAKELNCPAVAITDTNHGYGLLRSVMMAKKVEGIKPILGAEINIAPNGRLQSNESGGMHPKRLVFIAKNDEGYENLLALLSIASLEGGNSPKIDLQDLEKHKDGLIVLTGGANGLIWGIKKEQGSEKAEEMLQTLAKMLPKDDLLAELVAKNDEETSGSNALMLQLSEKLGIEKMMTSDARYLRPEDEEPTEILGLIKSGGVITNPHRARPYARSHFKSWEEIEAAFPQVKPKEKEEIRKRSLQIADKIDVNVKFGESKLPKFDVPKGETEASLLEARCRGFIEKKYGKALQKDKKLAKIIDERLSYELEIINKMGFAAYFLIVEDLVDYAKQNGISVGPGRGSAAGSIVSFLLDITTVDPIGYDLLFERFLNPARISMPDIDIDFSDERREEVMTYVIDKYGTENVSKVCTFGTLSAKAALKDVGRALGVEFGRMNQLTKSLPGKPGFALSDAEDVEEFMKMIKGDGGLAKVYDVAKKVEGVVRHVSVHACAVIIAKEPLTKDTPLQWSPTDDHLKITQFPYQQLEAIGLLKMDFLGLKNLSVLERALSMIEKTTGKVINLAEIPMDDKKTFEMLSRGETTGVFQFESAGMRRYLKELKPTEFEDLVAMNALYRPGPMEYIPQYIDGKHNPETVKYFHKDLEPILQKTYGIAVYQEQVLKIAQAFAGFSLGEADLLRKAIGKKIQSVLMEQKAKFVDGAVAKKYDKGLAEKLFDEVIVPFSGYGFNRSHAVCYSRIAYETAYLRANFPVEFMASLMTTDQNNTDRVVLEMRECQDMGIKVLPPDINASDTVFTVLLEQDSEENNQKNTEKKKMIRFGLTAIKGLGEETTEIIIQERKNGEYKDITDFISRVPAKQINKKTLEALTYSGSLDSFGDRGSLNASIESMTKYARNTQEKADSGQFGLFGAMETETEATKFQLIEEIAPENQILAWEKQVMGLYISGHPLEAWEGQFMADGVLLNQLKPEMDKESVVIHGQIQKIRRLRTRKGDAMAILFLEDTTSSMEVPVFPRIYAKLSYGLLEEGKIVQIKGKVNLRDGEVGIIANEISVAKPKKVVADGQKTITITLPEGTGKEASGVFKEYLTERKSENGQKIILKMGTKKAEVPFLVDTSGEFNKEVAMLIAGVSFG